MTQRAGGDGAVSLRPPRADDAADAPVGAGTFDEALDLLPADEAALVDDAARVAPIVRPLIGIPDPARIVLGGPTGPRRAAPRACRRSGVDRHRPRGLKGARRQLVGRIRQQLEKRIKENS